MNSGNYSSVIPTTHWSNQGTRPQDVSTQSFRWIEVGGAYTKTGRGRQGGEVEGGWSFSFSDAWWLTDFRLLLRYSPSRSNNTSHQDLFDPFECRICLVKSYCECWVSAESLYRDCAMVRAHIETHIETVQVCNGASTSLCNISLFLGW